MTYAELTELVKDYLEVDETTFNANIDQFIKLAEEDIYRKVNVPSTRLASSATQFTDGIYTFAVPAGFLAVNYFMVKDGSTWTNLIRKDPSYIREAYPLTTTEDCPKYYAQLDHDTLIVAPTPDATYDTELQYYALPSSIVDSSTSWLGDNAENALLYGTILQGYLYLKGSADMIGNYKAAYDQAINNLSILCEGLQKKDEYRHGSRRIPT